jgi:hypothetical protein
MRRINVDRLVSEIRKRNLQATIELMSINDIAYIPALMKYIGDENEYVHAYLTLTLSSFPPDVILEALSKELSSEDERRKNHAIEIINRCNAKKP